MSVKLVRANSDTPNIQNNDDCRLFRYACGGYDGIVKGFGNELNYEIRGSNFIVKSGEFVIDGWQGKIDGSGVSIAVDNLGGVQYYVVYAEIDLSVSANQKAEIKATYNTAYYPTISRGDDLTTTPSGVARIELYRFEASSGVISNVQRKFRIIDYGWIINSENATNLTGTIESGVLATTQQATDNSRKVATTEFVQNLLNYVITEGTASDISHSISAQGNTNVNNVTTWNSLESRVTFKKKLVILNKIAIYTGLINNPSGANVDIWYKITLPSDLANKNKVVFASPVHYESGGNGNVVETYIDGRNIYICRDWFNNGDRPNVSYTIIVFLN